MTVELQKTKQSKRKATTRQTAGVGYDFEDLTAAWLMVKMLRGIPMPGTETSGIELQWQTEALGWGQIDDLSVKCKGQNPESRQLAVSCKSNMQVTASGLPSDFVNVAWKLWEEEKPFQRVHDCMMLVQRGSNQNFFPAWSDLIGWCSDGNTETAVAKINASKKHKKIYESIKKPKDTSFSDEDTVDLISHLQVVHVDFQLEPSEKKASSLAHCRDLLQSGSEKEAKKLWEWLVAKAKEKRLVGGTMQLSELWQELVQNFQLKNHPDFASSWEAIERITQDYKGLIETSLPTGFSVVRQTLEDDLADRLNSSPVCVVYGSSGSGKSAFVKSALDKNFANWQQIWLSPEDLDFALAERTRSNLGLLHSLQDVLSSTAEKENIIVIDATERINPDCKKRAKALISSLLSDSSKDKNIPKWRVIIIGQTEAWAAGKLHELSGLPSVDPIEVSGLNPADVREGLYSSARLSWLASDHDALVALGNLKTLAWVMQAETAFSKDGINEISIPAIADRLWSYWTEDKTKLQNLLINLAEREALFERSFAISELDFEMSEALDESPVQFPLRKNETTNSYEFEHDLAADWARFQRLKEIKSNISFWAPYAGNPLWHNALRMLGQLLLREKTEQGVLWDVAFEEAEKTKDTNPLAADILLDALCLDPFAGRYLNERSDMLLGDNGARLNRLLKRFHHTATVSNVPKEFLDIDPSLRLYFEDSHRLPIYGRWPQVAEFLKNHKEKVANLISPDVSKLCETWLTTMPLYLDRESSKPMPYRKEFAELAVSTARALQLEQKKGHIWFRDDCEKPVYAAAFAAVSDIPEEVTEWALEMARRKPCKQDIIEAVTAFKEQKRNEDDKRLRTDKAYRERRKQLCSMPPSILGYQELPPWPLGPQGRVEQDFRKYCLQPQALARLMLILPQVASELLLAMIIDDSPKEDYSSSPRLDEHLGLEYDHSGYPTAYWKSPFFQFLQLNNTIALDTLIELSNFCMDRWGEGYENIPCIEITAKDHKKLIFKGDVQVFAWSQENSLSNGQLYSALTALERWLCMEIDKGIDVEPIINVLLERNNSVAIIGVLINVGKYKPELFTTALQPLLGVYELYQGDANRVENARHCFDSFAWIREGERIFEMAKEWMFAPYRQTTLRDLAIQLVNEKEEISSFILLASEKWKTPSDTKAILELRALVAELDRNNYNLVDDSQSGQKNLQLNYPDDLQRDIDAFNQENQPRLQTITLPYQCEQILQSSRLLTDDEAETLGAALNVIPIEEDQESVKTTEAAIAATLLVKAPTWLNKSPDLKSQVDDIVTNIVNDIGDTIESLRSPSRFMSNRSLAFVTYAVVDKWMEDTSDIGQWDSAVLRILTSDDNESVSTLMNTAYRNREHLGDRWWRLLQISIFWSGLRLLGPDFNEEGVIEQHWARWLKWLRSRKLNVPASISSVDLISVANCVDRLKRSRIRRLFKKDAVNHLRYHRRGFSGLETYTLNQVFSWLWNDNNQRQKDIQDECILAQKLWEFEVWRKKRSEKEEDEKDELPSDLGYSLLQKLPKLLLNTPKGEAVNIWKPVLSLGVDGHHAIEHFINGWLLEVVRCQNSNSLSQLWREMIEFALSSSNWSPNKYLYKGERLFRHILGFHSISFTEFESAQNIILEMKDLYKRWADEHLSQEEDNVAAFACFLSSEAGASIRLDGLLWIQEALSPPDDVRWRRKETGGSLIQLLDVIVSEETQKISSDTLIRDALLSVAAHLASKQVPVALALQERIRRMH